MTLRNRHWPVIHLRSNRDPRMTRCGLFPVATLITDDWSQFTCGACLLPYKQSIIDPR